jgi:hypothetical protein
MIAWGLIFTVCTALPFYLRFLIAICKECWHARICYLVRIEPTENRMPVVEAKRKPVMTARAA